MISINDLCASKMIPNPLSKRDIKVGSATYKKLLKAGVISEYKNDPFTDITPFLGPEDIILAYMGKLCCWNNECHNVRQVCCIHGDQRLLIKTGKKVYGWREGYKDGYGNQTSLEYAWKDYCPSCFGKCHRESGIPDIRMVDISNDSGWHTSKAVYINH